MLRNLLWLNTLDRMSWREKLAVARRSRGLSQAVLAQRISIRQATVSAWESGEANAGINDLLRAAEVLAVDPAWLFSTAADEFPTDQERAARAAFEARLRSVGPDRMLAELIGAPRESAFVETLRPLAVRTTPDVESRSAIQAKREHKRPKGKSGEPGPSAGGTTLPRAGGGPEDGGIHGAAVAPGEEDGPSPK
jgi:transcriptional regulator with XRE-family HTH domain